MAIISTIRSVVEARIAARTSHESILGMKKALFAACVAVWASVICLVLLAGVDVFSAAPQFTVDGSTPYEQHRIERIERTLNFTQEAMPDNWEVTIWPQDRFDKYVQETKTPTSIAFTFLGLDHTYINEYFLIWATDEQIQFVLGHEAGHMICECRSETKADEIARVLTGHKRPILEK